MDMKKKLEETYMPDKEGRKKRIVVGLSGGINSFVTAYLLKIQKYDLVGVTVAVGWDGTTLPQEKFLSCHLNNSKLDQIKEFCHQLGFPHMLIKANDEFKENVVESWVASRLSGTKSVPCWNCHELRMKCLYDKAMEIGAQGIATGHLAKLFHLENHGTVYVHSSNDEHNDQSALLARLPHSILQLLMLPLSDLQQKEVTKLAENFGLTAKEKEVQMHACFRDAELEQLLEKLTPARFRKNGELVSVEKGPIGDHQGIINFPYGNQLTGIPNTRQDEQVYLAKYHNLEKRIDVAGPGYFIRDKLFLTQCQVSEETPWSEPLKGVYKVDENTYVDCWIYPKNLNCAYIELEVPQKVFEGDYITIQKKKGRNAKVFVSGKVKFLIETPEVVEEEGRPNVKVDYSRDF